MFYQHKLGTIVRTRVDKHHDMEECRSLRLFITFDTERVRKSDPNGCD